MRLRFLHNPLFLPLVVLLSYVLASTAFSLAGAAHDPGIGADGGPTLPWPRIVEFPLSSDPSAVSDDGEQAKLLSSSSSCGGSGAEEEGEELRLRCDSWRVAGEANNLSPWRTVPGQCAGHVEAYMLGRAYQFDLEMAAQEAAAYARRVQLTGDGRDAWVFDIDETLLSNLPYYADHRYGSEIFDWQLFDNWVEKAVAPAIESSLKLYHELLELGFKIILLTGRSEGHRSYTVDNLRKAGLHSWEKLVLSPFSQMHLVLHISCCSRPAPGVDDRGKPATVYKSEKRGEMVSEGYRILGNSGDQWSDLLGSSIGARSFKLPNPMYYIP
ncbi:hypothetical protein Taro_040352 [Colocasia esculenta]|uniref:Acid phosphatase 1 n=1 Tax=Colocasia esculenta TaxID=4460 RepID=A0A843WIV0_COLES|nr:hypothetical protein [Colocasia esculenta]